MMTQAALWTAAGSATAVAVLAGVAEWLRARRRNLDRVGWVPWTFIQITAFFIATLFAILAVKA
ncbi:MAG TPA: hypothetical protein VGD10_07355 [Allosphingosinicella sp.]|uniref:hypothetical protein n=1 Tax=Allosphingosinicella sp. TaxID=2823234 RepID=UPI002ED7C210